MNILVRENNSSIQRLHRLLWLCLIQSGVNATFPKGEGTKNIQATYSPDNTPFPPPTLRVKGPGSVTGPSFHWDVLNPLLAHFSSSSASTGNFPQITYSTPPLLIRASPLFLFPTKTRVVCFLTLSQTQIPPKFEVACVCVAEICSKFHNLNILIHDASLA